MVYFTIALFFIYTFCLGFTLTSFVKNSENFLERNLMRLGFGLALLPFLGLVLNLLHIPIDWRIILFLSLIYPIYYLIRYHPKPNLNFKITKTDISILLMLLIFFVNLYIYASGAFAYPYLEDDDSWSHALSVKYISIEKKVFTEGRIFHYISPYPPTYDLLLGILHQTNNLMYFTLKFFNALIVSLSTIFFYFFVKEFTQSKNKALFATFALASIPAFMSHFIWAITLSVPLYFICFYTLERIKYDKKWFIVAGLSMVTAFTSSPTHSTYFGLFLIIYLVTKMILEKSFLIYHSVASFLGVILSFLFWWLPMIIKYGVKGTLQGIGFNIGIIGEAGVGAAFRGTGDRIYTFSDFFVAQKQNMINNPIGIGIFLSILTIIAIIFLFFRFKELIKSENHWLLITFVLFIFTLYAVNAARFPIKLSPFRAWMLLAIPVCILSAEGAFNLMSIAKQFIGNIGKFLILSILLIGIFFTSTQQKIAVNTSQNWPPGGFWTSNEEIQGYIWIKENLPKNTKIFTFVNNAVVIGNDMYTCHWCKDVKEYQKQGFNETARENYEWLKKLGYSFIVIDGQTSRKFGVNETNNKIQEFINLNKFKVIFGNNGLIILEI